MSNILRDLRRVLFFSALFAFLLIAHLCHSGVLWAEEDLPLAAARSMLQGRALYRDIWFDKPPLVPAVYLAWGASIGPVLRVAGAVWAMLACWLAYAFAATAWTRREGYWAAGLLGFYLTFDTHSAVLPLAADLLLIVPHFAAVLLAFRKQAFASGIAAGVGFLFNTKGVFVLAACALFTGPAGFAALAVGFALPNAAALAWLAASGSLGAYIDQVWRWPSLYAASPVVADPILNGLARTANWAGFHVALLIGALAAWVRRAQWRLVAWAAIALVGVALGWRFFPRYFFLLLPPVTLAAARGFSLWKNRAVIAIALLTLGVPLGRFGPRYAMLGLDLARGVESNWSDLALDRDSRVAARLVRANAPPGASLYVWGYRPEMYVYTQMRPATRFLDSQAMTGVPADRHLTQTEVVLKTGTDAARSELARSSPDLLIDGLSLYNPALSMSRYPELANWLKGYREVARTQGSILYRRISGAPTTIGR